MVKFVKARETNGKVHLDIGSNTEDNIIEYEGNQLKNGGLILNHFIFEKGF